MGDEGKWQERTRTRAAEYARARWAEKVARGVERSNVPAIPLTLDALIDAIGKRVDDGTGWDLLMRQQYAIHLVQSYCVCEVDSGWRDDGGGWELCAHARDEGF